MRPEYTHSLIPSGENTKNSTSSSGGSGQAGLRSDVPDALKRQDCWVYRGLAELERHPGTRKLSINFYEHTDPTSETVSGPARPPDGDRDSAALPGADYKAQDLDSYAIGSPFLVPSPPPPHVHFMDPTEYWPGNGWTDEAQPPSDVDPTWEPEDPDRELSLTPTIF